VARAPGGVFTLSVIQGDITTVDAEAIVNAANPGLRGGGGVDGAIHRAAGPRLAEAAGRLAPCETGEAVATEAFDLAPPVRFVIHTVGPVWRGGHQGEPRLLASCYRRCLEVAEELGVASIAFPAISAGAYGYPPAAAARVAVDTVRGTASSLSRVLLVAFDAGSAATLAAALAG